MRDPEPASLEATDSNGNGLRIDFGWQHDRYSHTIVLITDAGAVPLLQSIEGSDEDDWPPSPPLQQLSIEEIRPGVTAALLVGMAGTSHWSASVEADAGALIFDVACRSRVQPVGLASSYRLLAPNGAVLQGLALGRDMPVISRDGETLIVEPIRTTDDRAMTTRWKYGLDLADAVESPACALD